jgi:hypothetical protein
MSDQSQDSLDPVETAIADSRKLTNEDSQFWAKPLLKLLEAKQEGRSAAWFNHLVFAVLPQSEARNQEEEKAFSALIADVSLGQIEIMASSGRWEERRRLTRTEGNINSEPDIEPLLKKLLEISTQPDASEPALRAAIKEALPPDQLAIFEETEQRTQQHIRAARELIYQSFRCWASQD